MNLIDAIRRTKREHWIDALWWLALSSLGGLLPIWGLWFFLVMLSQSVTLDIFTNDGELALYSAATLSAAIYVITKENARSIVRGVQKALTGTGNWSGIKGSFPGQRLFFLAALIIVILSIFIFTGATLARLPDSKMSINTGLLQGLSIILFLVSTALSYIITALDNSLFGQSEEDISNMWKQSEDELNSEFEALRKGK